jgi:hypothetical protein
MMTGTPKIASTWRLLRKIGASRKDVLHFRSHLSEPHRKDTKADHLASRTCEPDVHVVSMGVDTHVAVDARSCMAPYLVIPDDLFEAHAVCTVHEDCEEAVGECLLNSNECAEINISSTSFRMERSLGGPSDVSNVVDPHAVYLGKIGVDQMSESQWRRLRPVPV